MCDFRKPVCPLPSTAPAMLFTQGSGHINKTVIINKLLTTCILYWWIGRFNYPGSLDGGLVVVSHMGISSTKCQLPYTEQWCSPVRWEKKKKGTVGLKWRFNRCRRARQRRINIQRGMHKPWPRAVEWMQPGLCVWGAGWQSVPEKPMGDLQDSWMVLRLLSYTNWAAGHLFSLSRPHTRWHGKGVRAHEYSRTSRGEKEKPRSAERNLSARVTSLRGNAEWSWNTDTL